MEKFLTIMMALSLILNGVLALYVAIIKTRIRGLALKDVANEQEIRDWRNKLLDKIKEKILITEQSELRIKSGEDIVAKFIYQQDDIKQLGEELFKIFSSPMVSIKEQYPQLTELDLLVICLLGIGMDNLEIYTLLRMEKRTLYRRRQLIAMRIGISSMQLDEFAISIISEDKID